MTTVLYGITYGVDTVLEEEADRLIKASLSQQGQPGYTPHDRHDLVTPYKQRKIRRHEVLVGVADPATRMGLFKRAANLAHPWLNSRDGIARALTSRADEHTLYDRRR